MQRLIARLLAVALLAPAIAAAAGSATAAELWHWTDLATDTHPCTSDLTHGIFTNPESQTIYIKQISFYARSANGSDNAGINLYTDTQYTQRTPIAFHLNYPGGIGPYLVRDFKDDALPMLQGESWEYDWWCLGGGLGEFYMTVFYVLTVPRPAAVESVSISAIPNPVNAGTQVTFFASPIGGTNIEFKWWFYTGVFWAPLTDWSGDPMFVWVPGRAGNWRVAVWARSLGRAGRPDADTVMILEVR